MSIRVLASVGVLLVSLLGASTARADMVTWTIRGDITMFTGSTPAIPYSINTGEAYVLTLTLDDDMPGVIGSDGVTSGYNGGFIEATLQFVNGSVPFTFSNTPGLTSMTLQNDYFSLSPAGLRQTDSISASMMANIVNGYTRYFRFDATRTEPTAPTGLTSLAFPSESEAEAMFLAPSVTSFYFRTNINGRYYTEVRGSITSLDVAPVAAVPLPAAAGLFSLAMMGVGALRRRRLTSR